MRVEIELTEFQAGEVQGLLDNIDDTNTLAYEMDSEEDAHPVWGILNRRERLLTILEGQAQHAIDDLEYRAEWNIVEAPNGSMTGCALAGQSAARSLRSLIEKIRAASL